MDENQGDQGKKTNASPEHKPKNTSQKDVAPPGSIGRAAGGVPGLGLGAFSTKRMGHTAEAKSDAQNGSEQAHATNDLPIAVRTDDEEIDAQSEADGYQLKYMDEIKEIGHGSPEEDSRPRISQSDYAKAFRQARDRTNEIQNGKDRELE